MKEPEVQITIVTNIKDYGSAVYGTNEIDFAIKRLEEIDAIVEKSLTTKEK